MLAHKPLAIKTYTNAEVKQLQKENARLKEELDILSRTARQASSGGVTGKALNRITALPIIQANLALGHRITTILKVLQIPRSTYYHWLSYQPSPRELENQRITDLGHNIRLSSNKVYGYKRVYVALKRQGIKRVWRLMKAIQAQSIMQRRFRK